MPLSQRVGEKKRYHYSANPRHTSYSRGGHHQQHSGSHYHSRPTVTQTPLPSHGSTVASQSGDARPSRYDPNTFVSKTFPQRSGSRYKPDSNAPSPSKRNGPEIISRYSGSSSGVNSRYNPQPGPPPSTAPISGNGSYHSYNTYAGPSGSSVRGKRPLENNEIYDTVSGSNGYLGRAAGNWRDSPAASSSTSSNTTIQQLDNDVGNPVFSSSSLKLYRRSNSAGNNGSKHYRNLHYGSGGKYSYQGKYSGIDDRYEMPKSRKSFEKHTTGASSLINSVPMTTRQIEQRVAQDHKRIDLRFDEERALQDNESGTMQVGEQEPPLSTHGTGGEEPTDFHKQNSEVRNTFPMFSPQDDEEEGLVDSDYYSNSNGSIVIPNNGEEKSDIEDAHFHDNHDIMDLIPDSRENNVDGCGEEVEFGVKQEKGESEREDGNLSLFEKYVDPLSQGPHVPQSLTDSIPYPSPIEPVNGCIFPMREVETQFWLLKNKTREERISNQKYLLKQPIKSLSEYPFICQNKLIHKQALRPVLCAFLSKLKRFEYRKTVLLKHKFLKLQKEWTSKCEIMNSVTQRVRSEELEEKRKKEEEQRQRDEERERELNEQHATGGLSRRRNRADFVDDAEIESVLLQIDPDYKHHQLAASIPPMILNPIQRHSVRFKDVNNLVTDKDKWASRVLTDAVDTFSNEEHDLFVEAYLSYPKRFGKVAALMGGLRTPEECVLHYYRTKKDVNYKKLIVEKNKKRKTTATKKRKEKDKEKWKQKQNTPEPGESAEVDNKLKEPSTAEPTDIVLKQIEVKEAAYDDGFNPSVAENEETDEVKSNLNPNINDNATEDELEGPPTAVLAEQESEKPASSLDYDRPSKRPINEVHSDSTDVPDGSVHGRPEYVSSVYLESSIGQVPVPSSREYPPEDGDDSSGNNRKKAKQNDSNHRSSYWSVKESDTFPILLRQYGSQWHLISEKLGTKSTTMVRNYFQRKAVEKGWQALLEEGEANYARMGQVEATDNLQVQETEAILTNTSANGIPPPQAPTLGFFNINKPSSPVADTPKLRSVHESTLQQNTPTQGLPPQHVPSIQLQDSVPKEKVILPQLLPSTQSATQQWRPTQQPSVHFLSNTQMHEPQSTDISRRSSIRSILNDNSNASLSRKTSPARTPIESVGTGASAGVIVQELNSSAYYNNASRATGVVNSGANSAPTSNNQGTATLRSNSTHSPWSSITSILNQPSQSASKNALLNEVPRPGFTGQHHSPAGLNFTPGTTHQPERPPVKMSLPPVLPLVTSQIPSQLPQQRGLSPSPVPAHQPAFNFANNPLAALAAVASAPEALGLLSSNTVKSSNKELEDSSTAAQR